MNKIHNKEGPDHDVGCHIFRLSRDENTKLANDRNERRPRDGTERMPRDGTEMQREGTQRMPRDGTERMPRDGTDGRERVTRDGKGRLAKDGIERMPRDGTDGRERVTSDGKGGLARDVKRKLASDGISDGQINVSNQNAESIWVPLKYPIIKPPGKGFFNRAKNFRQRNEIGGKPPFGCGEAELCPDVNEGRNEKFSKFLTLKIENRIVKITI